MTNTYIQQMKNIATAYYTEVCKLRKTIEYNNTTFSRDLADKYNEETEQEITNEANKSIEKINAVFEEIKSKISIRNFLCGENFSSNVAVFESGIINQEEFNILLQKYYNDYAFVSIRRLVSKYPELEKATGTIRTASDYVLAYKKFAVGAVKLILSMRENPRFSKVEFDAYADEDFSSGLYSIIGTGSPLQTVFVNSENEFMAHTFDSVTLEVPSDSFTFAFKGVR
nr:hypothetical protein [Ruminococcus bromii]